MPIHRETTNNSNMAIHKKHQPPPDTFLGFHHSYKRSTNGFIESTRQPKQHQLRRSQRLAMQRRALHMQAMESSISSTESSSRKMTTTKPLTWKQSEATVRPKISSPRSAPKSEPPDHARPSFLESLTERELSRALSYYYDFPQNLPYRESGAHGRADGPMPDILVSFDEDIFSRKTCLRPLFDDDLESADPFSLDTGTRR